MNKEAEMKEKLDILAELKCDLEDLKQKFDEENHLLLEQIANIEEEIRDYCLEKESSLTSDIYMAVFTQGRATWDGKLLSAYAKFHPEILEARKQGAPFVSFRKNTHIGNEVYKKIYFGNKRKG